MKNIIVLSVLILGLLFMAPAGKAEAYSRVRGYFRRSGTYVMPYYRSSSNSFRWDNYSAKGNINPWNGKRGYASWWK